jgi:hypothetical protein
VTIPMDFPTGAPTKAPFTPSSTTPGGPRALFVRIDDYPNFSRTQCLLTEAQLQCISESPLCQMTFPFFTSAPRQW